MRKILIIDDDEDTHLLVKASLKKFPIEFVDKYDGLSGLDALSHAHHDMIFLDVLMPNGSGGDFLQFALSKAINLPTIILITSLRDAGLRQNALNIGVSEVLNKPVQPSEIRETVAKYLFPSFQDLA